MTTNDEVDGIVAAWRRRRPDLDPSPMLVLSRVSRLARHLDLRRRAAFADHCLDPWEFDVLASLRRADAPCALTPGALMAELLVSSGTMTNRIDRLESRGLVSRSPSPKDRRAVLVTLTPEGRKLVDGALEALLECERAMLSGLSMTECDRLAALLRAVVSPFDRADAANVSSG